MKHAILITQELPSAGMALLKQENLDVYVHRGDSPMSREELAQRLSHAEGLICLLSDIIDKNMLKNAKNLKVISNYAVGYNNIDIETAAKLGIAVCNTPDVLTRTTAELAWALLLAAARRICEADRFTRSGKFKGWKPDLLPGLDVHGKILGIIGAGRIGQAMAKMSYGFDMKICYSGTPKHKFEQLYGAVNVPLETLLEKSDYISLHVPLTEKTHHLIGKEQLARMKSSAVLINTSRGAVVDENALLQALTNGYIAAAGLDVYENEPDILPGLMKLDNVILAPHIGSATHTTRNRMAEMAVGSCISILEGDGSSYRVV